MFSNAVQVKKQREKKESMRFLTCNKEEKDSLKFKLIENFFKKLNFLFCKN